MFLIFFHNTQCYNINKQFWIFYSAFLKIYYLSTPSKNDSMYPYVAHYLLEIICNSFGWIEKIKIMFNYKLPFCTLLLPQVLNGR